MEWFWQNGAMTVSELRERMPDPKPHVNTISTQVRLLESNGFLGHEKEAISALDVAMIGGLGGWLLDLLSSMIEEI